MYKDCSKRVVIVGAGLTLADLLGFSGIDVLLIEREATTVQEARAVNIDDEGTGQLEGTDKKER